MALPLPPLNLANTDTGSSLSGITKGESRKTINRSTGLSSTAVIFIVAGIVAYFYFTKKR